SAAAARARTGGTDAALRGKGVPVVARQSEINGAVGFAAAADRRGVPEHEHPPICVGGDRAAAIKLMGGGHQIFLRREALAVVAEPRVEQRRAEVGSLRVFVRAVPTHVHAAVASERELGAANGPNGNGASRLAVDAQRSR